VERAAAVLGGPRVVTNARMAAITAGRASSNDVIGVLRLLRRRVRSLSDDADELAGRLEKLAAVVDALLAHGLRATDLHGGASHLFAPASSRRRLDADPPALRVLGCDVKSDGSVVVAADAAPPLVLRDSVGSLLLVLHERGGRDVGDGLGDFKSVDELRKRLETRLARVIARRAVVQLVYRLRGVLALAVADGARLVEHRRGFGYRVRVSVRADRERA
jgi:hypothetical protein